MSYTSSREPAGVAIVFVAIALVAFFVSLGCDATPRAPQRAASPGTEDPRTPVALPPDAQQAVLREMRQMLGAMGGALSAAAREDSGAVLAALAPARSAAAADPAIETMLPAAWKAMAERTHGGFDTLAAAVRRARTGQARKDTVLAGIARVSGSCTACHETYRVTVR